MEPEHFTDQEFDRLTAVEDALLARIMSQDCLPDSLTYEYNTLVLKLARVPKEESDEVQP